MIRYLRMKCSNWGYWNKVSVNKIFLEQPNPIEPKIRGYDSYVSTCTCLELKDFIDF